MKRRAFLAGSFGLITMPRSAKAQRQVWRIGFLSPLTAAMAAQGIEALRQGLREFGYVEGKNLELELRYTDGKVDRFPEVAAELVRLKVDVIVATNNQAIMAAHR